jgi:hypothetical protein
MLQNAGDLRRMREGVEQRRQPIYAGFEKMRDDAHSQLTYKPAGASEEVSRNPTIRAAALEGDCNAAYQLALMGVITGNADFFRLCAQILDDWSGTLKRITGADAVLCAGLSPFKMANAAEILRAQAHVWPAESATRFGIFLKNVVLPVLDDFAPFANGNWDTAALKTMMAIAIYNDDRDLFDRVLVYYNHGCGDGRLEHYVYANGQCQESGRDQQHTQLGLAHMGDCCEMAWHQGLDLYGMLDNRLLKGFEYTARYVLGEDVPFEPDLDQTGKYRHQVISVRSPLRAVFEQIYNHYVNRRGLSGPWVAKAAEKLRPEGPGFGADHTGFGTLLYSRPAGADPDRVPSARVAGVHVAAREGALVVDWVPLVAQSSYSVVRTEGSGRNARRISVKRGQDVLQDSRVRAGDAYSYRVTADHAAGLSNAATAIAGLPSGWQRSSMRGSVTCSGGSWLLTAGGAADFSVPDAGMFCVSTKPSGDGALTARLSPVFASQALTAGLVCGDATSGPAALLLLEPGKTGGGERVAWTVRLHIREAGENSFAVAGEQTLASPMVQYGRMSMPLSLRLRSGSAMWAAEYSVDGVAWTSVGQYATATHPLRAGMVVASGLETVTTDVVFDHVAWTH